MKDVWDELLKEIGAEGFFAAIFGLFFLVFSLIGLLYVCS